MNWLIDLVDSILDALSGGSGLDMSSGNRSESERHGDISGPPIVFPDSNSGDQGGGGSDWSGPMF